MYGGTAEFLASDFRDSEVMANSATAPTMNLTAATPSDVAESGPSAREVPVVAKQNAAKSTNRRERTAKR
jgi:hypothetical protein